MTLDGKVGLLTGAARGQGAAEARLFVEQGGRVVIADLLDDDGEALADELGDAARFVHLDVSDEGSWRSAVAAATEAFGGLHVLVNNAGIHHTCPIEEEKVERLERTWRVNLLGTFLGIQSVIAPMRAAGGGSIVNISSTAGLKGLPRHGAYGATKWAVRGLTKTTAVELGRDGIRVNSVHPGPIRTAMLPEGSEERFLALPLGRAGEVEEVATLVCFLASDAASYITGGEFAVDGGSVA